MPILLQHCSNCQPRAGRIVGGDERSPFRARQMQSSLVAVVALLIAIGHGQAGGGLVSLRREVHHLRPASALSAKQQCCSTWPGLVGCVKSLRGGSEALHSPDFGPLETRLAGLEQMQAQGHLSEAEVLAERERLLLESASRNLDLQQAAGRTPTAGEASERQNMTIARRANDNLARALAERPQHLECADGSAGHGLVRPDGRVSFSAGERAVWRRRSARLAAEEAAGLHSHCCGKSRDDPAVLAQCRSRMQLGDNRLFPYWAAATQVKEMRHMQLCCRQATCNPLRLYSCI